MFVPWVRTVGGKKDRPIQSALHVHAFLVETKPLTFCEVTDSQPPWRFGDITQRRIRATFPDHQVCNDQCFENNRPRRVTQP